MDDSEKFLGGRSPEQDAAADDVEPNVPAEEEGDSGELHPGPSVTGQPAPDERIRDSQAGL
jgi:hypothetical protein